VPRLTQTGLDSVSIPSIDNHYTSHGDRTVCTVEYGLIGLVRLRRQGWKLTQPVGGGNWVVEWAINGMNPGKMK